MKDKVVISDLVVALANGTSKSNVKNILKNLHVAEAFSLVVPKSLLKNVKVPYESESVTKYGELYLKEKAVLISTPK